VFFFHHLSSGLIIATSTRGADHLRGNIEATKRPDLCHKKWGDQQIANPGVVRGKHLAVSWAQQEFTLADCLGRCKCGVNLWEIACPLADVDNDIEGIGRAKIFSAVTGGRSYPRDLEIAAERVLNLERAFILRQGITRKHDKPPRKVFTTVVPRGPLGGYIADERAYEELLNLYYKHMGWDIGTGVPTRAKLETLGLGYVADELERDAPYPEWTGPYLWPLGMYPHNGDMA
jgi:aldehyde:ferredoxin oxidoreductase